MSQKVFALVDCNSFFCSCERLFRPDLAKRPIAVLSNNDGCFISMTRELKDLGLKVGAPYFKYKKLCEAKKVEVFSSNFSLYTNLSDRVMATLSTFAPEIEVYSVDEAFLDLTGFKDPHAYAHKIKTIVERNTGIPVSIGLGPSKTTAKVANHIAKRSKKARGVVHLGSKRLQDIAFANFKVEDIWGVGRASARKLRSLNIKTAKEYRDFKNKRLIQKIFTKVGLQRQEELQGHSRFFLSQEISKKKEIICSRSFGDTVCSLASLREAVANHVSSACEKLRKQDSVCAVVEVYAQTSPHRNTDQYYAADSHTMLAGSSDTRKVIKYALGVLDKLYKAGYQYSKAGVRVSKLSDKNKSQTSFFEKTDDHRSDNLMQTIDVINRRDGPGTIRVAACGLDSQSWQMKSELKSPRYLTGWSEVPKVG